MGQDKLTVEETAEALPQETNERWPGAWDGVTVGGIAEDGSLIWVPWEGDSDDAKLS